MSFEPSGALAFLSIVFGMLACFWGYRIFRTVLGILGFLLGAWLFYQAGLYFGAGTVLRIILAIFGGLIGASLSVAFFFVGIFILGAAGGWHAGMLLWGAAGTEFMILVPIALALIGGLLALFFQRVAIVISTSLIGAWTIVSGGFYLMGSGVLPTTLVRNPGMLLKGLSETRPVVLISWLALALAGTFYQFRFTGGRSPARKGGKER